MSLLNQTSLAQPSMRSDQRGPGTLGWMAEKPHLLLRTLVDVFPTPSTHPCYPSMFLPQCRGKDDMTICSLDPCPSRLQSSFGSPLVTRALLRKARARTDDGRLIYLPDLYA
jgi:hypothetical protein